MSDPERRYRQMMARLKAHGYRLTPQRLAVIKRLAATDSHPTAQQLHAQLKQAFPTMSLATVYKTLNVLQEVGEVLELGFSHDDNRYDGRHPKPHPHVVCVQCGTIMDAKVGSMDELAAKAAETTGYQMVGRRVEFYGICPSCQACEGEATE